MSCTQYVPNQNKPVEILNFKAIVLRSIDRNRTFDSNGNETDTSSNFTLNVFPPVTGNYRLGNLTLLNSLYNINTSNNTIFIYQSGTAYSGTITPGAYNASSLPTAVATALNAITGVSGTFSCTYSTSTFLLTITNSTTAFQMNFNNSNQIGCADVLGFPRQLSSSAATSQTGSNAVNFNPFQSLFINIDQCSARYSNPLKSFAILGCVHVPLVGNSGSIIQVKYSDFPEVLTFDQVSQFNIQVRDSGGAIVKLMTEWELQIIAI